VTVLANSCALDLGEPPRRPAGYAEGSFTIRIESDNTTQVFVVDASTRHRLSPEELATIKLFTQLQSVLESHMAVTTIASAPTPTAPLAKSVRTMPPGMLNRERNALQLLRTS
jgi:hypothetical protein